LKINKREIVDPGKTNYTENQNRINAPSQENRKIINPSIETLIVQHNIAYNKKQKKKPY